MTLYTYLALGDSYTIGEAVPLRKSFPCQVVQLLRKNGWNVAAPEIVAQTGWTTDELLAGIAGHTFLPSYDIVSLLIGVNNQYRGRPVEEYRQQFELLLQKAIHLAAGESKRVFVLSIPDYGVTPFAKERNPQKIAAEIDAFNRIAFLLAQQYKAQFIDITVGSRTAAQDTTLLAEDGLHPSAKEYNKWAVTISALIADTITLEQ